MKDPKQKILDEAERIFIKGDYNSFAQKIKELYDSYITCNCFFYNQSNSLWVSLISKAEKLEDDINNFNLNFSKGFIYLRNDMDETAFKFLSIAIAVNPKSDICFALRSSLHQHTWDKTKDAEEAVSINPSARNYFVLAGSLNENNRDSLGESIDIFQWLPKGHYKTAINYYKKSISLNNNFPCAYYNLGLLHEDSGDYNDAVDSYLNCIKLQPKHWCYYNLCICLIALNKYDLASHYIEVGLKNNPNDYRFFFALGEKYYKLKDFELAIGNYETYLGNCSNPESYVFDRQRRVKEELSWNILEEAITEFNANNFEVCKKKFDKYFSLGGILSADSAIIYYTTLLKYCFKGIEIDISNPHYLRLNTLREGYKFKQDQNEAIVEDEKNINKLMIYQSHYKVGFGIHEGLTISDIIELDAKYVLWCVINLQHFMISMNLFEKFCMVEIGFLEAVEINLIKGLILKEIRQEIAEDQEYDDGDRYDEPNYNQWLNDEFGDDAETAFWNMD